MARNGSSRKAMRIAVLVVALMAAIVLAIGQPVVAWAEPGSISITQHDPDQTPIGGGKAAIYQVGISNGSSYQYVGDFASLGDDLTSHIPNNPDTGKVDSGYLDKLETIARESSSGPLETLNISSNGKAKFDSLERGVYLVVQVEPAPGYNSFDRFLVTIPWYGKDQTDPYNVNASPKLDPVTSPDSGNPSTNPGGNPPSNNPSGGSTGSTSIPGGPSGSSTTTPALETTPTVGGTLPQTGQLWWPVAVLGGAGVVLFAAGKRTNGKRAHES